jgi:uncharacterized linocin/CFP29 family protein
MNDLKRELAPISNEAWTEIEDEAAHTLKTYLAARKLVDFRGPEGWDFSAVNLGKYRKEKEGPVGGVEMRTRVVQPMVELKVPFELSLDELDSVNRGLDNPDLDPVRDAARKISLAEDNLVFYGSSKADFEGICSGSIHSTVHNKSGYGSYPATITEAIEILRETGVYGPYAIALSPRNYKGLASTVESGYPIINHIRRLIDGPIVWAPAIKGALVLSMRGGDFELLLGRDVSIGYTEHTKTKVGLYLEESLTFRLLEPEAAVIIADKK